MSTRHSCTDEATTLQAETITHPTKFIHLIITDMNIDIKQLCLYNSFVNTFLAYYKGYYNSTDYAELSKEVYKTFNFLDPSKDIADRYNYCLEISKLDNTTDRINEILHF